MEKNKRFGYSTLIFISILSIFLCLFLYIYTQSKLVSGFGNTLEYSKVISFENIKDSIYIKTKSWGITGDHSHVILSKSIDSNDYIIERSGIYYKRQDMDSLFIYYPSGSYSNDTTFYIKVNNVNIKIVEYRNSQIKLFEEKHQNHELLKISAYDGIEF